MHLMSVSGLMEEDLVILFSMFTLMRSLSLSRTLESSTILNPFQWLLINLREGTNPLFSQRSWATSMGSGWLVGWRNSLSWHDYVSPSPFLMCLAKCSPSMGYLKWSHSAYYDYSTVFHKQINALLETHSYTNNEVKLANSVFAQ